ncbi:hypothetical protein My1_050 [Pectobacterium phage My1]|uniref:Uncharacterized protein n=1 Tax=Pectobacterium phage My1 TaxID=1204539 RepID=J9QKY5_9CAUD|nr:hypothetical protein My1_050 [Pectobacterium phage My1]AFQ22209.1 hypothetical protein My1_050 [Pectobacterium phage My1]
MRRKLKRKYIRRINSLREYAKGWPLQILIADRRPRYNEEFIYYRDWDKYCRTKQGRLSGAYEEHFGVKPSRLAVGNKRLA